MNSEIQNMIMLWSGAIANIPTGWHLCDGAAGTPDLRDRFIVGAGDTYSVDDTGGAANHTHTFSGGSHVHHFHAGVGLGSGADGNHVTDSAPDSFTSETGATLPTYYALAYIMKL